MIKHIYTDEEKEFIQNNYIGIQTQELVNMLNEKFNSCLTYNQLRAFKKNHGLKSGVSTRFVKGGTSHNKGKKMSKEQYEKCKGTMFSKGHAPHNKLPVGAEVTRDDGYVQVKIAEPNKWKLRSRINWESVHGQVPDGYVLIRKNQIRDDDRPENFILAKQSVLSYLNIRGLMQSGYDDVNEVAINLAILEAKISDVISR